MKCSFIVSAYSRPLHLRCLLASLITQTERDFEVIITDNAKTGGLLQLANQREACEEIRWHFQDSRIQYLNPRFHHCYEASNWGAALAAGDYLCFPSDDCYYVPSFLETMLAKGNGADLIYCDMLYDPRRHGRYAVVNVQPGGDIDKGGFLVRREKFQPFPWDRGDGLRLADHYLINDLIKAGVTHQKVDEVLWVHN